MDFCTRLGALVVLAALGGCGDTVHIEAAQGELGPDAGLEGSGEGDLADGGTVDGQRLDTLRPGFAGASAPPPQDGEVVPEVPEDGGTGAPQDGGTEVLPDGATADAAPDPECGDGVANGSEECDILDNGGSTCASMIKGSDPEGFLVCQDDCTFDTRWCEDPCYGLYRNSCPLPGAIGNGVCQDGSAGSASSVCQLGTDCRDCGPL